MTFDKLFGYAFLISLPLSFLDKTSIVREYYQSSVVGTGFADLHWIFLAGYIFTKLIEFAISLSKKK